MSGSINLATFCASLLPASVPPPFVCLDAGAIESPIVWEEQRDRSRSPPAETQPAGPEFVVWVDGWYVRFVDCACMLFRGVVWCRSDANSAQNRLTLAHAGVGWGDAPPPPTSFSGRAAEPLSGPR